MLNEKAKIPGIWQTQRNYEPQEELHCRYAVAGKNVSDSILQHGKTVANSRNSIKMSPQMSSLMKFALNLNDSLKNSRWLKTEQASKVDIRKYQWFVFENIVFLGGFACCLIWNYIKRISVVSMAISALVPMQLLERMSILSELGKLSRQCKSNQINYYRYTSSELGAGRALFCSP